MRTGVRAGLAASVLVMTMMTMMAVGWSGAVWAAQSPAGYEIAKANACLGCHAVDRKLVGPAFRDIATKYKGDAKAPAQLEKKVRDGGAGVWGVIPMPSHPRMSNADIQTVVGWVLAGAPKGR